MNVTGGERDGRKRGNVIGGEREEEDVSPKKGKKHDGRTIQGRSEYPYCACGSYVQYVCITHSTCVALTPRRMALVAAANTGSPALTIWPKDTAPTVRNGLR